MFESGRIFHTIKMISYAKQDIFRSCLLYRGPCKLDEQNKICANIGYWPSNSLSESVLFCHLFT